MQSLVQKMIAAGVAAAAAVAARRVVEYGWTLVKDEPPPTAAGVRGDTELRDLLLWSGLVAGAVVLARKVASDRTERLLGSSAEA